MDKNNNGIDDNIEKIVSFANVIKIIGSIFLKFRRGELIDEKEVVKNDNQNR